MVILSSFSFNSQIPVRSYDLVLRLNIFDSNLFLFPGIFARTCPGQPSIISNLIFWIRVLLCILYDRQHLDEQWVRVVGSSKGHFISNLITIVIIKQHKYFNQEWSELITNQNELVICMTSKRVALLLLPPSITLNYNKIFYHCNGFLFSVRPPSL